VGLQLRTSPDNYLSTTTVTIIHADEIQLDNGLKASDWNSVSAIISSSGAGGLDTGSEAASAWYEIYAIYNSTSATKNLLLHRAKNFTLDQQNTTSTSGDTLLRANGTEQKVAQSFLVGTAGKLEFIDVKLFTGGSPTGNFWYTVEADSAGSPSGVPLATSDKMRVSLVSATAQFIRVVFRSPATLSAATTYWLVQQADYTPSDSDQLRWSCDATASQYANGTAASFNGSVWDVTAPNAGGCYDEVFKTYVTQNDSAVTMPSGYSGKTKIGYVYNNYASNFEPFLAQDRAVSLLGLESSMRVGDVTTANLTTLIDISTTTPPVPVVVWVGGASNNSNNILSASPTPGGFGTDAGSTQTSEGAMLVRPGTTQLFGPLAELGPVGPTYYQSIYGMQDTSATARFWIRRYTW
jgi:hypothetical protein